MRKAIVIINVVVMLFISLLLGIPAIISWDVPASIIDLMMAGCLILSAYWWFCAMTLLSSEGQDEFWNINLWSKLFAGRENFTREGWRYWVGVRYAVLLFFIFSLSRSLVRMWP